MLAGSAASSTSMPRAAMRSLVARMRSRYSFLSNGCIAPLPPLDPCCCVARALTACGLPGKLPGERAAGHDQVGARRDDDLVERHELVGAMRLVHDAAGPEQHGGDAGIAHEVAP